MGWFFDATQTVPSAANTGSLAPNAADSARSDGTERSISQIAESFGVSMRTLRFYEEKGLLQPRRLGNRRFYSIESQARLRLILKGKAMGLGLDEIGELVSLVESDHSDGERARAVRALCERQHAVLRERRDVLESQILETDSVISGLIAL